MARTKPYEIIDNDGFANCKVFELKKMLEHYGFVPYFTGGGHIHFKHREYDLGHFGTSKVQGTAERGFAIQACDKCMEVKRLNAERKKPKAEEIPSSITDQLDKLFAGFDVEHKHGVIRLKILPDNINFESPDRTYEIAVDHGGGLAIKSLSFSEYAASVPLKLAAERAEDVLSTFKALDEGQVIPHIQERERKFHAALADLESSAGCKINRMNGDKTPLWRLEFPSGIEPLTILAPKAGAVIANETIAAVDALTEKVLEQSEKCEAILGALKKQGCAMAITNGDSSYMKLSHSNAKAKNVQVPVYGELRLFNEDLMQLRIDNALGKGAVPTPQITEPTYDRVKATNHR